MGRPSKPAAVLEAEKKSHRTKAELEHRKEAEKKLQSSKKIYERREVKNDKTAHSEFMRVKKLMKAIEKDDALYSSGINTYCQLYSEIKALQECIDQIDETAAMLIDTFEKYKAENTIDDPNIIISFEKSFTKLVSQKIGVMATIDKKRKMMLDIDKENVMTISASLRVIPKQPDKAENPLLKALGLEDVNN